MLPRDPFGRTPQAGPIPWEPACMGGWCAHRDSCAQHAQASAVHRQRPVERLCARGCEQPVPMRLLPKRQRAEAAA